MHYFIIIKYSSIKCLTDNMQKHYIYIFSMQLSGHSSFIHMENGTHGQHHICRIILPCSQFINMHMHLPAVISLQDLTIRIPHTQQGIY